MRYLKAAKVPLNEYEFPKEKIVNVQSQLERLLEKNFYLNKSARDGYRAYLLAYASHSHKEIFNVHQLDLAGVGKSFGLVAPPMVNINVSFKGEKKEKDYERGGGSYKKGLSTFRVGGGGTQFAK